MPDIRDRVVQIVATAGGITGSAKYVHITDTLGNLGLSAQEIAKVTRGVEKWLGLPAMSLKFTRKTTISQIHMTAIDAMKASSCK